MRRRPDPDRFAYASSAKLLAETFDGFLPPSRISVAEHAAANRWVKSAAGPHLERYSHDTAPYTRGPMECLTEDGIETVAIVGPAASGKTAGPAESWLLQTIEADPADMLWYMQTEDARDAYVKGRIQPMLDAHDKLIGHLRVGRDSLDMLRFRGGRVEFLPFTASSLVNKHVQRIVADEWDGYDPTLGDPLELLNFRRQAAGADSKLLAISHPDLAGPLGTKPELQRGIMRLYANSDRRTWWWPCPHCGAVSSPNPGTARRMVIHYPEEAPLEVIEAEARLLCPSCGGLIEDHQRQAMNRAGRWICAGEQIDEDGRVTGQPIRSRIAGFWIVGAMSAFVMGGIGALARNRVAAERAVAAGGAVAELRSVMVKGWGEPLESRQAIGTVDAATLAERADPALPLGVVPVGARFLTAWADAQNNRWELLVRAWGEGAESWIVQHQVIPGDPAASEADWDALLERLAEMTFPLADRSGRHMRVRAAGFDAYGQPGVSEQAYAAWLRRRKAGKTRRLGVLEGRDAWDLVPTKGATGKAAPRIQLVYPNTQRRDRKATARGQVPLLLFNPNQAKDALVAQLVLVPPRAGAVNLPAALLSRAGPPHPFLEQLTVEHRDPVSGRWEAPKGARNEATDMMVGCEIVARLHGLHRIDWTRPPAWAAEWETNSMIIAPEEPVRQETAARPDVVPAKAVPVVAPAVVVGVQVVQKAGVGARLAG